MHLSSVMMIQLHWSCEVIGEEWIDWLDLPKLTTLTCEGLISSSFQYPRKVILAGNSLNEHVTPIDMPSLPQTTLPNKSLRCVSTLITYSATRGTESWLDIGQLDISSTASTSSLTPCHYYSWELSSLDTSVTYISIDNGCCNEEEMIVLDMVTFAKLKKLRIGDKCFKNVVKTKLVGMMELEEVVIGANSFTRIKREANGALYVKNCPKLRELKIRHWSFSDYSVCTIEDVPSLTMLEMASLVPADSCYCFCYASLELKSVILQSMVMHRLAFFESRCAWRTRLSVLFSCCLWEWLFLRHLTE